MDNRLTSHLRSLRHDYDFLCNKECRSLSDSRRPRLEKPLQVTVLSLTLDNPVWVQIVKGSEVNRHTSGYA